LFLNKTSPNLFWHGTTVGQWKGYIINDDAFVGWFRGQATLQFQLGVKYLVFLIY
jgi:hypothetical protein